jgi:hypothetical protein
VKQKYVCFSCREYATKRAKMQKHFGDKTKDGGRHDHRLLGIAGPALTARDSRLFFNLRPVRVVRRTSGGTTANRIQVGHHDTGFRQPIRRKGYRGTHFKKARNVILPRVFEVLDCPYRGRTLPQASRQLRAENAISRACRSEIDRATLFGSVISMWFG